jgi:radical SAM superfamily enzyme YgiQ (UPF0313 family)
MRVLLVVPTQNYAFFYPSFLSITDFPTGVAYLASALKAAGHEVAGLNANNDANHPSAREMVRAKLQASLARHRPQLIGLSGLCGDFEFIRDAMAAIRAFAPGVPIVCGGGLVNNDAEYIFTTLRPEFCVVGEGEEVLVQLVAALESGQRQFEGIPNLGYWQDGSAVFTPRDYQYPDVDSRPFPDYSPFDVEDMLERFSFGARTAYRYSQPYPRPWSILTARSCPFRCSFCVHHRGARYRQRAMARVIEEIRARHKEYRFNLLIILDELFANNKKRFEEFCQAVKAMREQEGIAFDWLFQTHASVRLDANDLTLAKEAGCILFSYGIESASPTVLKSMNKTVSPDQIVEAIRLADKAGVGFGGNFIFGDPAETPETFLESMEFLLNHCLDSHINIGVVCPYPGSRIFDACTERGVIPDRLAFYETLDKHLINMTAMPDDLWGAWISKFCQVMGRLQYVKTVDASRYVKEDHRTDDLPVVRNGICLWSIWASCPHCGRESFYRELLREEHVATGVAYAVVGCLACHKRMRVYVGPPPDGQSVRYRGDRQLGPDEIRQWVLREFVYPCMGRRIIEQADARQKQGETDAAVALMLDSLRAIPPQLECEYALVGYLLQQGRLSEAAMRLQIAADAFPDVEGARADLEQVRGLLAGNRGRE